MAPPGRSSRSGRAWRSTGALDEEGNDRVGHFGGADGRAFQVEFAGFDLCDVEDVVADRQQRFPGPDHDVCVPARARRQVRTREQLGPHSTPFVGARISWLTVATKVDFAALAASAGRFASQRSAVLALTSA